MKKLGDALWQNEQEIPIKPLSQVCLGTEMPALAHPWQNFLLALLLALFLRMHSSQPVGRLPLLLIQVFL